MQVKRQSSKCSLPPSFTSELCAVGQRSRSQEVHGLDKMKKLGHYVKRVKGQHVVVMPKPKGTPWTLEQGFKDCSTQVSARLSVSFTKSPAVRDVPCSVGGSLDVDTFVGEPVLLLSVGY
jgi:hypothetical protein